MSVAIFFCLSTPKNLVVAEFLKKFMVLVENRLPEDFCVDDVPRVLAGVFASVPRDLRQGGVVHPKDDVLGLADSAEGDVELAVGEDGLWEDDADFLEGLSLRPC